MTQQKTSPQEHQSIPIFDFPPTPTCNMHKVMDHAELLIIKFHILHYPLYSLRMFKNAISNQLHCENQQ